MPTFKTPLEEYLDFHRSELSTYLNETNSELALLNQEEEQRRQQIEADVAFGNLFGPGDIPAGMNLREQLQFIPKAKEGLRRQAHADLAQELGDRRAEILDDRNRQQREFLNRERMLSLANTRGVLNLLDVVPKDQGLRTEIVPSVDRNGNPTYQQVHKLVDEKAVRTRELADWLGVPEEVAQAQIEAELTGVLKERKADAREARAEARAARADQREEERAQRQAMMDRRRAMNDEISLAGELVKTPELLSSGIVDYDRPAAKVAATILKRQVLGSEASDKKKEGKAILNETLTELTRQLNEGELPLPIGPDDTEGQRQFKSHVESLVKQRTSLRNAIKESFPQSFDDFGIGDPEKKVLDDIMQETLRQANSPYGKLERRTSDLERFFGVK